VARFREVGPAGMIDGLAALVLMATPGAFYVLAKSNSDVSGFCLNAPI
jgi:hypothetical protein